MTRGGGPWQGGSKFKYSENYKSKFHRASEGQLRTLSLWGSVERLPWGGPMGYEP